MEMRGRVVQALVERTIPDKRSVALIALLHTIKHEPKIIYPRYAMLSRTVDWIGLTRAHRRLIARGEEIAKSNWAPEAMRNSIVSFLDATKRAADAATTGGGG